MDEPPRPKDQPILPRPLFIWLVVRRPRLRRLVTLGVIVWADDNFDEAVAHTMGLVDVLAVPRVLLARDRDEERTIFSSELLENPTLLKASALSLLTIFLATTFGPLQRILDTTELTVGQWALCIVLAASIIVVAEVRKVLRRRSAVAPAATPPALQAQAS